MSMTGLEVFDETMHKTNRWLKEIEEVLGSNRHQAYQALRGVLHCLRDRLTVNEAAQLGDQLPMFVASITKRGTRPEGPRRSGPVTNSFPGSARIFQGRPYQRRACRTGRVSSAGESRECRRDPRGDGGTTARDSLALARATARPTGIVRF
jgi:hypothetical protein